jgi:hypothetical protein
MTHSLLEQQIVTQLRQLSEAQQQQVLDFTQFLAMKRPVGVPGKALLHLAGTISHEDAQLMLEAIEEGCGQVDWDEW